ncbi:MAG: transporter substrate-binding domain-containing protein, partial [Oscillospiraceae bacterium]|nr:transporter substrate-binding domain-containing protein [Oscillospiraceae bacterium]
MKKIIALALVLCLALCLVACGGSSSSTAAPASSSAPAASQPAAEQTDWEYIKEKGTLVVGMTIFDPMNYYDADGKLIGFDTELAEAVAAKLGIAIEFQEIEWNNKVIELNA